MAAPFPPLRIARGDFHRKPYRNVTEARSPNDGRVATEWSNGIRWTFSVYLTSEEELEALTRHFNDDAGGRLDPFLFTCPDLGGEYLVVYDQDELDIEPHGATSHRCAIALRTVAG